MGMPVSQYPIFAAGISICLEHFAGSNIRQPCHYDADKTHVEQPSLYISKE
jgi:hypothetical protein